MDINLFDNVVKPAEHIVPQLPADVACDVAIIGAGPNGLITGAYLAKAGLKVVIAEKRYEIGGGLATEEVLFPLYYANTHATYHLMVDYMPVLRDFDLKRHGLQWIKPAAQTGMLFKDGGALSLSSSIQESADAIAAFSEKDAAAYEKVARLFQRIVEDVLAPATYWPAVPPAEFTVSLNATSTGQELMKLSELKPVEVIDLFFSDKRVRALLLYMIGMWGVDPQEPGMGFMAPLLINRGVNKYLCYGGSHKFASALAREVVMNNGLVLENAEVKRIIMDGGVAKGIELFDGTVVRAHTVVSSLNPNTTFLGLIGKSRIDAELARVGEEWEWDKWSFFTVHLALKERPAFRNAAASGNAGFLSVIGFDGDRDVLDFFESVKKGVVRDVGGHVTCETVHDPTLVRKAGHHTAFFQMPVPYDIDGGWETRKKQLTEAALSLWSSAAINITPDTIIATEVETPLDIERRLASMVRGSIKHGDYTPLQMGSFRPSELMPGGRTGISGLYLCGASTYPGGLIIGGPGYISANTIADDLKIKKWWTIPPYIQRYVDTYIK